MNLIISFLYLCLHIAVIIFVAFLLKWLLELVGVKIEGNVYKWGQVIVILLCVIAVVVWLAGVVGGTGPGLLLPRF